MKAHLHTTFAVTIAFPAVAVLVTTLIYVLSVVGLATGVATQVDSWLAQGAFIVASATTAGLVVDSLRFAGDLLWRKDTQARVSPKPLRCQR